MPEKNLRKCNILALKKVARGGLVIKKEYFTYFRKMISYRVQW